MNPYSALRFAHAQLARYVLSPVVAAEWMLTALAAAAVCYGTFDRLGRIRHWFHRLAQRKMLAVFLSGLLPIVLRLSLLPVLPVPIPSIHDEFSHLLLGDTLAHGRMTNPVHPLWQHFESIHILQQPTYASMYQPGQGSFLALGEILFHQPWAGVVLSVALMCAALCWMLQGWLPPAWAFYGTLIAIFKIGVTGPWMNSYLGGPVSALAAALLLGVVARVLKASVRWISGIVLGVAVLILANSRPFEGLVLATAALLVMSWHVVLGLKSSRVGFLKSVVVPATLVLVAGGSLSLYYNYRVTGNSLRLPYQVNRDTYGWPENPAFLPPKKLTLRHKVLQDMYLQSLHNRDMYLSIPRFVGNLNNRFLDNWSFFVGPALTLPLLFLPRVYRDRRSCVLVILLALMLALNLTQMVLFPYHFGPSVPLLFAILTQGARHLYASLARNNRRRATNLWIVLPVLVAIVSAGKQAAANAHLPMTYWERSAESHRGARAAIAASLEARPGKQLVVVRYSADHNPDQEWVYNSADIDGSKVVWAREMSPEKDRQLLCYFRDRQVWLLRPDRLPPRLIPYPGATCAD